MSADPHDTSVCSIPTTLVGETGDRGPRYSEKPVQAPRKVGVAESGEPSAGKERVLIGVCTLNEASNIGEMVRRLRSEMPHADVLVVDDNSPDGTASMVEELAADDARLRVDVRKERGLGGAIRHAMNAAIEGKYDWFINLDGDFSHDPADLPRMMKAAQQEPSTDVVIGSRYTPGGSIEGWPVHRRLMSRMVNRFATLCLRLPVRDCSGSMRCYRVRSLADVGAPDLASNGYSILEEVLVQLNRHDAKFVEVPITFTDRKKGVSKLTAKEAARAVLQMVRLATRL